MTRDELLSTTGEFRSFAVDALYPGEGDISHDGWSPQRSSVYTDPDYESYSSWVEEARQRRILIQKKERQLA